MSELTFSFTDCIPVPQEPQITVSLALQSLGEGGSNAVIAGYSVVAEAARDFCGWLTVTVESVIRNVMQAFCRIVCEAKALFNRTVFFRQGGLRL